MLDQVAIADDLLLRMEATMSKNQISEHLGISKATLYEWRKQEQIE
ncbi:helix-turn-helix domain-containing protein [Candidatus Darwinibacter acetoxidans]